MEIDRDVTNALEEYKRAKRIVHVERQRLLAVLPEDVATEFHYNGRNAVYRYPQYAKIFNELLEK